VPTWVELDELEGEPASGVFKGAAVGELDECELQPATATVRQAMMNI
jgi:hypothetical protein